VTAKHLKACSIRVLSRVLFLACLHSGNGHGRMRGPKKVEELIRTT